MHTHAHTFRIWNKIILILKKKKKKILISLCVSVREGCRRLGGAGLKKFGSVITVTTSGLRSSGEQALCVSAYECVRDCACSVNWVPGDAA